MLFVLFSHISKDDEQYSFDNCVFIAGAVRGGAECYTEDGGGVTLPEIRKGLNTFVSGNRLLMGPG